MKKIGVGLLGLGTVGMGTYQVLKSQQPEMLQKLGVELEIRKIAVKDPEEVASQVDDPRLLTADWREVVQDDSVEIVIELTEEEWNELFEFHGVPEDGTLCLCAMDLTYEAYLILTGPMHGRVVYLDYDGECAPMWPKDSPDFLTWCENFYSELLAGYDIAPTWKFMWQEPGDENALIRAFQSAEDREYKREVLYSFCKFKKLSKTAKKFLENLLNSEFQDEVTKVLQDFHL